MGAEHPGVSLSLTNLAFLYQAKGDFQQAEQLFQRVLTIREQTFGIEHPEVAEMVMAFMV